MRIRVHACLAVTIVFVTVLLPVAGSTAGAGEDTATGLYSGPAAGAALEDFSAWLGSPVSYAVDFVDHTKTWNDIANPYWLMDPWSSWVNRTADRRLVISVPLLPNSASGQLAQGAAGSFDTNFRTLTQNLVARNLGGSVVRLGWEMNNTAFPWYAGKSPDTYISYYRRIVSVMRSVPGAAFAFDWCPLAGVMSGSPLTTFSSFYPGDDVVDIIGLDNYDIKWQDTVSSPGDRWNFHLERPLGLLDHRSFAAEHGKPMSFAEWGLYTPNDQLGGGGDNPYYIDRMADWFASNPVTYQSYFNADWGGGTLNSFPMAKAEYKIRFGTASMSTTTTTIATPPTTATTISPTTSTSIRSRGKKGR